MSDVPVADALIFLAAFVVLIAVTQSRRLHPFLAIALTAFLFALAVGLSGSLTGKTFGVGFSQSIWSPGLVIVAAAFVAGLAESSQASDRLMALVARWGWSGSAWIAAVPGFIAGFGFAGRGFRGRRRRWSVRSVAGASGQQRVSTVLALAISASHGLVLFSPVVIAAVAILDVSWSQAALFGLPVAVLATAAGALWSGRRVGTSCRSHRRLPSTGRWAAASQSASCWRWRSRSLDADRAVAGRHSERAVRRRYETRDDPRPRPPADPAARRRRHHGRGPSAAGSEAAGSLRGPPVSSATRRACCSPWAPLAACSGCARNRHGGIARPAPDRMALRWRGASCWRRS